MHDTDSNYNNVILHVVWRDDISGQIPSIPTLVLEGRVSMFLLKRLLKWSTDTSYIPCANQVSMITDIALSGWKERLMVERLQKKAGVIRELLQKNNYHWEEVLWWMIALSFGLVINAEAFMAVAMSIPLNILKRHRHQLLQLESMLFGQAGLLTGDADDYLMSLQREYCYLKEKYDFKGVHRRMHFLRMRPPAFPTIRIAQMAVFLHKEADLFQSVLEMSNISEVKSKINVPVSDYWNDHYVFGVKTSWHVKRPGEQATNAILINAIIPFLFSYGEHFARSELIERAISWINELPPEQNTVTRGFQKLGLASATAMDSQAFIQLKSKYCDHRRCLECAIGNAVLRDPAR
jgi:hypothetical protein